MFENDRTLIDPAEIKIGIWLVGISWLCDMHMWLNQVHAWIKYNQHHMDLLPRARNIIHSLSKFWNIVWYIMIRGILDRYDM